MLDEFGPKRIVDTPITEDGFTGIGDGAGLLGLRSIDEFMTWNLALQSIDHIVNSCAKAHYMSNRDLKCPIEFRGINKVSARVAAQHSQCFGAWFASCAGLKVILPYNDRDNIGLLRAAIRDPDPVIFLENEMMNGVEFDVTAEEFNQDFLLPLYKAKIERSGTDIKKTDHAKMVGFSL
jgi:pyruvate dehydrogenase E1 component beta subunit